MVIDNIEHSDLYINLHPLFKQAFDFIQKAIKENLQIGKYEIDGEKIYAFIQEYDTKIYKDTKPESHCKYIDIQFVANGTEIIEVSNIKHMSLLTEYDETKDIIFYKDTVEKNVCILKDKDFGIFFPNDVHRPCISANNAPSFVKKIVVKIKLV